MPKEEKFKSNKRGSSPKEEGTYLNKEIKNAGIILIVLGIIHLIFSGYLSSIWGILLIFMGIISLIYRSKDMILVFGVSLILVGILNIFISIQGTIYDSTQNYVFWIILGIAQIVWGIGEMKKFPKIRENPKYDIDKGKKKDFVWQGLRIGFWTMISLRIFEVIFSNSIDKAISNGNLILVIPLTILEIGIIMFVIINSILHLTKYKNKTFAIMTLIISILFLLGTVAMFFYNLGGGWMGYEYEDSLCSDYCYNLDGAELYYIDFENTNELFCYCLDSEEILLHKEPVSNLLN
jgi:hypothetical protein